MVWPALALGSKVALVLREGSLLDEEVAELGFERLVLAEDYVVLGHGCFAMGCVGFRCCKGFTELGNCMGLRRWMSGLWWNLDLGRLDNMVGDSKCLYSLLFYLQLLPAVAPFVV